MLNFSFFITSFASITWLIYSIRYLSARISTLQTETGFLFHAAVTVALPIMTIWGIFALIKSYYADKKSSRYAYHIFEQIQKNTEALTEISQTLLGTQNTIKNSSIIQEFNLLISDINEILSDIIKRSNSVSSAQLEHLWTRTSGGERWILAKTFIEISNYQPEFIEHLKEKAIKDSLLKGSILEFHARYKHICNLMNQNDHPIFNNMIEYGALGKVYEMLRSVAQSLQNEASPVTKQIKSTLKTDHTPKFSLSEERGEPFSIPSFLSSSEENTPSLTLKAPSENMPKAANIDEGLKAIRDEILSPQKEEPRLNNNFSPITSGFSQTQIALKQVTKDSTNKEKRLEKKTPVISLDELEEEINNSPENNYDEYAYPFGAWLNDKKSQ